MKHIFYDLNVGVGDEEILKTAQTLGWDGVCLTRDVKKGDGKFCDEVSGLDVLTGAMIPSPIRKNARKALELADMVLVEGGDESVNRKASECWEVDVLAHPERNTNKDFMHQRNSGIDHIMARFMKERCIAIEINFSEVLNSSGNSRARILGRMRQNVMLARKYKTPVVLTSGARDKWGLRAPGELMAFGRCLGMTELEARTAVCPAALLKKVSDRKNPDIILKGLEVLDWGKSKPKEKKMCGWY